MILHCVGQDAKAEVGVLVKYLSSLSIVGAQMAGHKFGIDQDVFQALANELAPANLEALRIKLKRQRLPVGMVMGQFTKKIFAAVQRGDGRRCSHCSRGSAGGCHGAGGAGAQPVHQGLVPGVGRPRLDRQRFGRWR